MVIHNQNYRKQLRLEKEMLTEKIKACLFFRAYCNCSDILNFDLILRKVVKCLSSQNELRRHFIHSSCENVGDDMES